MKALETFKQLCEHEYATRYELMVDEFKSRKNQLIRFRDRSIQEYKFIGDLVILSVAQRHGNDKPEQISVVENQLAELTYENIGDSLSLAFWRKQYGETLIIPMLSDMLFYFLKQFNVKEMLTGNQVQLLAVKLLAAHPLIRIRELLFVLNQALAGEYGPTYQHIGIDTIMGWITQFYEKSSIYLEAKVINSKPDGKAGNSELEVADTRLRQYSEEQKQKKRISEEIWKIEKGKRVHYEDLVATTKELDRFRKQNQKKNIKRKK